MKASNSAYGRFIFGISILLMLHHNELVSQQVIAAGGGFLSPGTVTLTYTMGEPVTGTLSASDRMLTQGFQQPANSSTFVFYEGLTSVMVFPNPFSSFVEIEIQDAGFKPWHLEVCDLRGVMVHYEGFSGNRGRTDLSGLLPGCYLVRVSRPGSGYLYTGKMIRH